MPTWYKWDYVCSDCDAPTDPTIPLLRSIIDYNLLNGCHIIGLDL
jgi:hypothetical protein